eukprot:scaffold15304_cov72-Phaeocystis_antarctica.AAC.4
MRQRSVSALMQDPGCNWNRRSGPSSVCASPSSSSHRLTKPERREAPSLHRTTVPHAARMRVSLPPDRLARKCPTLSSAVSPSVLSSPTGSMLLRCGEIWCAAEVERVRSAVRPKQAPPEERECNAWRPV